MVNESAKFPVSAMNPRGEGSRITVPPYVTSYVSLFASVIFTETCRHESGDHTVSGEAVEANATIINVVVDNDLAIMLRVD